MSTITFVDDLLSVRFAHYSRAEAHSRLSETGQPLGSRHKADLHMAGTQMQVLDGDGCMRVLPRFGSSLPRAVKPQCHEPHCSEQAIRKQLR